MLTTDWFDKFILGNGLQYVIDSELSDDEILSEFVASTLPEELAQNLKAFLATVDGPLAVRSSSKLEDSNYQPFAGVYATYMCPPVENKDRMLRELGKAVKASMRPLISREAVITSRPAETCLERRRWL